MGGIENSLNSEITSTAILGAVPANAGGLFVTIILFSIGIAVISRILKAVSKSRLNV